MRLSAKRKSVVAWPMTGPKKSAWRRTTGSHFRQLFLAACCKLAAQIQGITVKA
jgi:hypothetical protein